MEQLCRETTQIVCIGRIEVYCNCYPHKNSQAVKNGAALKSLGEKICEIKGGGQEMVAMMLILINFNNASLTVQV